MTKEELIVNEKYKQFYGYNVEQLYLDIYSDKSVDVIKSKLYYLFAVFHCRLNFDLAELNHRITTHDRHFRADDSRNLLSSINSIFSLINNLKGSKYEFIINKSYYFYLKNAIKYLKETCGSTIPESVTQLELIKYEKIFNFVNIDKEYIKAEPNIDEVLSLVSTRNAKFEEMAEDEKLQNLNIAIEYMLKEKNKYMQFDYDNTFCGFVSEQKVIEFRNITQCFRHATQENLEKRKRFTTLQKRFMANYGLIICMAILNVKQNIF